MTSLLSPDKFLSVCHINVPQDKNASLGSMERSIQRTDVIQALHFIFGEPVNGLKENESQILAKKPHTSLRTTVNTANTLLVLHIYQANYSGYVMSEITKRETTAYKSFFSHCVSCNNIM